MKLKQDWFAVPHGEIYPKMFMAGTVLAGVDLERARALGLVDEDRPEAEPKTDAPRKRGRA